MENRRSRQSRNNEVQSGESHDARHYLNGSPLSDQRDLHISPNGIHGHSCRDTYDFPAASSTSRCSSMKSNTKAESVDRDEASYRARNRRRKETPVSELEYPWTLESWSIPREDSISPFNNHALDDSLKPRDLSPKEDGNKDQSLLYRTTELMDEIKGFSSDVSGCDIAHMLLPRPSSSMKSNTKAESVDRDEASYRARNRRRKETPVSELEYPWTLESWSIPREDNVSPFNNHALDDSLKPRDLSPKEDGNKDQSLLYRTTELMDQIKGFSSDISGCDIADMLLPPPNGKSTKERLSNDSSPLSDVPNISEISKLLEAGLSHEELMTLLLGSGKSSHSPNSSSLSLSKSQGGSSAKEQHSCDSSVLRDVPNMSDISKLLESGLSQEEFVAVLLDRKYSLSPTRNSLPLSKSQGTTLQQVENLEKPSEKKANLTNTLDESFFPMSHSVIDRDEESILRKYHIGNDVTIKGIESSNISWQLNPSDISLFREISVSTNKSNLHPISENVQKGGGKSSSRSQYRNSLPVSKSPGRLVSPSKIPVPMRHSPKVISPNDGSVNPSRIPVSLKRTSPKRTSDCQVEDIHGRAKKKVNPTDDISDKPGTSQCQAEHYENPAAKKVNVTNTLDESFVPMSHSIIDRDEESILRKYHIGNDVTIKGIESSNISWQLNPSDISLFREISVSNNKSNLHPISENVQKGELSPR